MMRISDIVKKTEKVIDQVDDMAEGNMDDKITDLANKQSREVVFTGIDKRQEFVYHIFKDPI